MMKFVEKFLDSLPFNGSKTKLGVAIGIVHLIGVFLPGLDVPALIKLIFDENTGLVAIAMMIGGMLHKSIKARRAEQAETLARLADVFNAQKPQ